MGNIDIKADHGGKTALHYAAESAELPVSHLHGLTDDAQTALCRMFVDRQNAL